jgi:hypothetical protein
MLRTLFIWLTCHLAFETSYGQNLIYLGQAAEEVQGLIKYQVDVYNQARGYKSVAMDWDTKYFNGKISEVILCKDNAPMIDLQRAVNYCTHYKMKNGTLEKIISQYENVSVEELKRTTVQQNSKVGDFYFTDQYNSIIQVYLAANGLATQEYKTVILSELPKEVQTLVTKLRKEADENALIADQKKKDKEEKIKKLKSETYDL